ncbi:MAG TPA: tetratricopeptide repeat protein [Chthonomonadaceae bacterium]|nr:tetratricopeptide repeat protein [Chthonomonadaceae bacterium]
MTVPTLPSLPAGMVTLLFAEIDNATALEEAYGARYRSVAAECSAALRESIAAHHGWLIKVTSDFNFFAAFACVEQALACIGEAMARLYTQRWPAAFGAHGLRAALTTGTPFTSGNDYIGPPVNRCARLLEIAKPWQILLTQAAVDALGDVVPAGLSLEAMGSRRLRDVEEPTEVFQARHPALPSAAPESRAPRSARLPAPLTLFVGREAELARLTALLRSPQTRLVTLHGVGGTGKTRLAVETLRGLEPDFPDGLWFLSFPEPLSAERLLATLAQAVGCPPQEADPNGSHDLRAHLAAYLRPRRCLLALDNFERLVAHGPLLVELLEAAPGLTCLLTSRELLGVPQEIEFPVPPLPEEEAVLLLADRLRAFRTGLALQEAHQEPLRALCAQLEGLPLALELVAPLLRGLSPAQLLARLHQRRLDIAGKQRDLDPRHQTLRHCLESSYETLSAAEQDLFARLSVFVGAFSAEAAQALCGEGAGETDVSRGLNDLRGKSLLSAVETVQETRYRMLDIVREFASEKLGADREALRVLRDRHARYYVEALREARRKISPRGDNAYVVFCAEEMENLRAGMAWAQQAGDPLLFADYVLLLAAYFIAQAQWDELRLCAPLAARSLEQAQETDKLATLLIWTAHLAERTGDLAAAARDLQRALALIRQTGNPKQECITVYNLGTVWKQQGDLARAQDCFEETLTRARALQDEMMVACALHDLGDLALQRKDLETAQRLLTESRENFLSREERRGVAMADVSLAQVLTARGDFRAAHAYLVECLQFRLAIGERYALLNALYHIAHLFQAAGAYAAAAPLFAFLCEALTSAEGVLRQKAQAGRSECERALEAQGAASWRPSSPTPLLETLADAAAHAQNAAYLPPGGTLPAYGIVRAARRTPSRKNAPFSERRKAASGTGPHEES